MGSPAPPVPASPSLVQMLLSRLKSQPASPPPDPSFNPERPWDTPLPRVGGEQAPGVAPMPRPSPTPGAPFATPDPMRDAQRLAERQQAVGKLTSPVTPVTEIPSDLITTLRRILGMDVPAGPRQ